MERVAVLIPAYNEEKTVGETVRAVLAIPEIEDVIVIDDGSEDETPFVAYDAGARVIQTERNLGKGGALSKGLAETDADIILMIDADLGPTAVETRRLLEPVIAGHADMAIAVMSPPVGHRGGFGFVMRLSKWAVRRYGGADVSAPLSGQRAVRRALLEDIGGFAPGFAAETMLTIDALRKGYRIVEVPLPISHRFTGRDWAGFVHRARQFIDILLALRRRRRCRR